MQFRNTAAPKTVPASTTDEWWVHEVYLFLCIEETDVRRHHFNCNSISRKHDLVWLRFGPNFWILFQWNTVDQTSAQVRWVLVNLAKRRINRRHSRSRTRTLAFKCDSLLWQNGVKYRRLLWLPFWNYRHWINGVLVIYGHRIAMVLMLSIKQPACIVINFVVI